MTDRDPRESKLPVWAQDRLTRLRWEIQQGQRELASMRRDRDIAVHAGPADSDTFIDLETHSAVRLGKGTVIRFGDETHGFEVSLRSSDSSLGIQSYATTYIEVIGDDMIRLHSKP